MRSCNFDRFGIYSRMSLIIFCIIGHWDIFHTCCIVCYIKEKPMGMINILLLMNSNMAYREGILKPYFLYHQYTSFVWYYIFALVNRLLISIFWKLCYKTIHQGIWRGLLRILLMCNYKINLECISIHMNLLASPTLTLQHI